MKLRLGPIGAPVAIVLAWVAVRVAVLFPVPEGKQMPQLPRRLAKAAAVASESLGIQTGVAAAPVARSASPLPKAIFNASPARRASDVPAQHRDPAPPPTMTARAEENAASPAPFRGRSGIVGGYAKASRTQRHPFTGSGWALVNGTGGAVGVPSLGGSQAGMRVYLQGSRAPLALTARVSRAIGGARDTEVSAGYALRGRRIGVLVERRERLDVRSGAFVVTGYAGAYDVRLPAGLHFDGFSQGGVAGIHSRRWFADGQARVTRRVSLSSGLSLGAGGGAWASAQQGVRRVEAGPLVEARIRSGAVGLRVAGEYRFRVTGDAYPHSGPALTVGMDF